MKYIFRGHIIFEYLPNNKRDKVKHHKIYNEIPAFDFCHFVNDDYRILSEFFDTIYRHTQGEDVELKDIIVD